jgi:Luciferase-like monooxygenase
LRLVAVDDTLPELDGDVSLGVLIPTGKAQWGTGSDPRALLGFATRAEIWVTTRISSTTRADAAEALTILAALAPVTSRATLGTGALLPFLRRPVQATQALARPDRADGGGDALRGGVCPRRSA